MWHGIHCPYIFTTSVHDKIAVSEVVLIYLEYGDRYIAYYLNGTSHCYPLVTYFEETTLRGRSSYQGRGDGPGQRSEG